MSNSFRICPDNPPLPRAGIYCIVNLFDGRCYIGSSQNVRAQNVVAHQGQAVQDAVTIDGADSFGFEPLAYAINNPGAAALDEGTKSWLANAKADMIEAYDAVTLGYNIIGGAGSQKFANAIARAKRGMPLSKHQTAALRLRAAATNTWTDPEVRERRRQGLRAAWADPRRRAQRIAARWGSRAKAT